MESTKDYTFTVADILHNLRLLGDHYQAMALGRSSGFGCSTSHAVAVIRAAEALVLQVPYWREVANELPGAPDSEWEDGVRVLAWRKDMGIDAAWFYRDKEYGNRWGWECVGPPSHWMPLPELPGVK